MFCQDCATRETCKKICKPLENYLAKNPEGYTARHIRRKEVPYADTDFIAEQRVFDIKYGKSYLKSRENKV